MAPVSDRFGDDGERDRAQLLLVGALSLAIALVAIALVLNSAIYTHNLASRQDNPAEDVVTFSRDARVSAGGHLDYVNRQVGNTGYGAVETDYTGGVSTVEDTVNERASVGVAATRIGHVPDSQVRGVRVVDDSVGEFRPRDSPLLFPDGTWVVAHDVRPRSFRISLPPAKLSLLQQLGLGEMEDALNDPLGASNTIFVVEFTNDVDSPSTGETWRVAFFEDGSGNPSVASHEVGSNIVRTCSVDAASVPEPLVLDLTGARFGGQGCAALHFVEHLPDTYTVKYYNGWTMEGTYELFADVPIDGTASEAGTFTDNVDELNYDAHCAGDELGDGPTYYGPGSSDYPRVVPAFYATDLEVRHQSPDVEFVGDQRVAPGEAGPDPVTPRITSLTVTEAGGGTDADFHVDADVTDPNGDLETLEVTVTGSDVGGSVSTSVSGGSDSVSSLTVQDDDDSDDSLKTVTISVTAVDEDGNRRTVTQSHRVDGDETGCPP